MDSKLLMVKCITLAYLETLLGQNNNSKDLILEVTNTIKIPESSIDVDTGREIIVSLRGIVLWILEQCADAPCDKTQLLQRLRVSTKDDTYLYNAIDDVISRDYNGALEKELQELVLSYRRLLKGYNDGIKIKDTINDAFKKVNYAGAVDYRKFVRDVVGKLEPHTHEVMDSKHHSVVDHVNFDEPEGINALLSRSKEEISDTGVLKTGWQAINRMLGESQGFRRGETVVVGALQHNFKTGFTMNLFKHFALYNTPYMRDPTKKPLLLHISLENELPINLMYLYVNLKENETKEPCDISQVNIEEATRYIKEKMGVNGYHIEMYRINPDSCGYHDLLDILTTFESKGYEIHAFVIDYLSMLNKNGLDRGGPTGTEIRQLFRILRNYCSARAITFITPHQLSTEAKALKRQGVTDFVKTIANLGYYEGSRQIDQEVCVELYVDISKNNGESFLTVQRGKHRKIKITPEKDLYTVLPFSKIGDIPDDINDTDRSLKSVGGTSVSEGSKDWFDI